MKSVPKAMTSASWLNRRTSVGAKTIIGVKIAIMISVPIHSACSGPLRARSSFPAP